MVLHANEWIQSPHQSHPIYSVPKFAHPFTKPVHTRLSLWFKNYSFLINNDNEVEFDAVQSNTPCTGIITLQNAGTGNYTCTVGLNATGITLLSNATFAISGNTSQNISFGFAAATSKKVGRVTLATNEQGFLSKEFGIAQSYNYTYTPYNAALISGSIYRITDSRTSTPVYEFNVSGFTISANALNYSATATPASGGLDIVVSVSNTGVTPSGISAMNIASKLYFNNNIEYYDLRRGPKIEVGTYQDGVALSAISKWPYPNESDYPLFIAEDTGNNRRCVISCVYPVDSSGSLYQHAISMRLANENVGTRPWQVRFDTWNKSDTSIGYMIPTGQTLEYRFFVRVNDYDTNSIAQGMRPYAQYFRAKFASGTRYTPNRTGLQGYTVHADSQTEFVNPFTANYSSATGWLSTGSGNTYSLALNVTGQLNTYWLGYSGGATSITPIRTRKTTFAEVAAIDNSFGIVNNTVYVNTTGSLNTLNIVTTGNPLGYRSEFRLDRFGTVLLSDEMIARTESSYWPRNMIWNLAGRSMSDPSYPFMSISPMCSTGNARIWGLAAIQGHEVYREALAEHRIIHGAWWGKVSSPIDNWEYPTTTGQLFDITNSNHLHLFAKELNASKQFGMSIVGYDTTTNPSNSIYDSLNQIQFLKSYSKSWNLGGGALEPTRCDILQIEMPVYIEGHEMFDPDILASWTPSANHDVVSGWLRGSNTEIINTLIGEVEYWTTIKADSNSFNVPNNSSREAVLQNITNNLYDKGFTPLTFIDFTFPDSIKPTGLIVTNGGQDDTGLYHIELTWQDVLNSNERDLPESYNVYRSYDNNIYSLIAEQITSNSYNDSPSQFGNVYYKVTTINRYGRESEFSPTQNINLSTPEPSGGGSTTPITPNRTISTTNSIYKGGTVPIAGSPSMRGNTEYITDQLLLTTGVVGLSLSHISGERIGAANNFSKLSEINVSDNIADDLPGYNITLSSRTTVSSGLIQSRSGAWINSSGQEVVLPSTTTDLEIVDSAGDSTAKRTAGSTIRMGNLSINI